MVKQITPPSYQVVPDVNNAPIAHTVNHASVAIVPPNASTSIG